MKTYIVDCEGDSLTPTKFHVVSYQLEGRKGVKSLTSYEQMKKFLTQEDAIFIMHNGMLWDKPELERVLDIKIKSRIIDTLFLSWYIFPTRTIHGLEAFGEEAGVPKPKVVDWSGLTKEEEEIMNYYENR